MGKKIDLTGERFGNLVAIERDHQSERGLWYWKCRCDCGNTTVVSIGQLRGGKTKSCGCIAKEHSRVMGQANKKHGLATDRLGIIWYNMMSRCYNSGNKAYPRYGGRGVTVCDNWHDMATFVAWAMENGYKSDLTLDRIDYNGNYSPGNCRWADRYTQANNKKNNRRITINGRTQTVAEWNREMNFPLGTIGNRLAKGWDEVRAVLQPLRK